MCLDATFIGQELGIAFALYRCFVPGIGCLQNHPEGAHGGSEHVVPKCEAVPFAATRRPKRRLQMGCIASLTGRTVDVQVFTCRINKSTVLFCLFVCLGVFFFGKERSLRN